MQPAVSVPSQKNRDKSLAFFEGCDVLVRLPIQILNKWQWLTFIRKEFYLAKKKLSPKKHSTYVLYVLKIHISINHTQFTIIIIHDDQIQS